MSEVLYDYLKSNIKLCIFSQVQTIAVEITCIRFGLSLNDAHYHCRSFVIVEKFKCSPLSACSNLNCSYFNSCGNSFWVLFHFLVVFLLLLLYYYY